MKASIVVGLPRPIAATQSTVEALVMSLESESADFEVVLVHQGELTPDFKRFYDTLEGDLRIVTVDERLSLSAALNAGAEIASGDIVALVGVGNRPMAGWLQALLAALESADIASTLVVAPDQSVLLGAFDFERDQTRDVVVVALHAGESSDGIGGIRHCKAAGGGLAFRRSLWHAIGALDPHLGSPYSDLDFCLRAAAQGATVVTVGEARYELTTGGGTAAEIFMWSERFKERWCDDAPCDPVEGAKTPEQGASDGVAASRYFVDIDLSQTNTSLVRQLDLIPEGSSVLELGCSAGHMTRVLASRNCRIVGVEFDPEAAAIAAKFTDRMVVGDLETLSLVEVAQGAQFDVLLAGDVLEHLRNPEAVLRNARAVLAPGGRLIGSVPNVAHGSVRLALLAGHWRYRPTGILDATHLRFFTRWSTLQMLRRAGYDLISMQDLQAHPLSGEIRVFAGAIPKEAIAMVEADPDAWVYQFVFEAQPRATRR